MPPPAYTPRRRLLLQVAMVLIFAGTMGLAAAVRHQRQNEPNVPLDRPMPLNEFTVPVPSSWTSSDKYSFFPFAWTVESTEPIDPNARRLPRILRVVRQKANEGESAEQFVRRQTGATGGTARPVTVAGVPGVLLTHREPTGYEGVWAVHLYAAAVLSNERTILVDLQVIGREPSARDEKLVRDVAAGIRPKRPATASPATGPSTTGSSAASPATAPADDR